MSGLDTVVQVVLSPEVIRPLIVAAIVGGTAWARKMLKEQKASRLAAESSRNRLEVSVATVEQAVKFFGDQLRGLTSETRQRFDEQASYRAEVRDSLHDMQAKLHGVDKELHPNGGSSMKDALGRVEAGLQRTNDRIESVDEKLDAHLDQANYQIGRLDRLAEGDKT